MSWLYEKKINVGIKKAIKKAKKKKRDGIKEILLKQSNDSKSISGWKINNGQLVKV